MSSSDLSQKEAPQGASSREKEKAPRRAWPELMFAGCMIVVVAIMAVAIFDISAPTVQYSKIGPQVFPIALTIALGLCGFVFIGQGWRGGWRTEEEREEVDWIGFAFVVLAILIAAVSLRTIGFIPAASLLFFTVALGFGSRRYLRDGFCAVILCSMIYVGLTQGLTISLPVGPFERLLAMVI